METIDQKKRRTCEDGRMRKHLFFCLFFQLLYNLALEEEEGRGGGLLAVAVQYA